MIETSYKKEKAKELIDSKLTCSLKHRQDVTIPGSIRKKLFILPGEEVIIGLEEGSNDLFIRKYTNHSLENKMVVSDRGSIRIPTELTRALGLCKGDMFHIYLVKNENGLLLKKVNL
ncbi:AbrB/MazE/SpoVT family DNA-binding domain-containing protein [Halalkalibacter alkalisediminis]|uniref:AbrB/MazE/SpoVT family DNA-binding domain-containing protein n=1 Tax=Halalkalibacter alkalisediminis TaxID=935616 RepID=A0ABV6NHA1_9BACI|nr:AbrB/MazE/SpoVT family DNA-binding domain-containing protein [Halalkalibacter alkalisediminis]